MLFVLTIVLLNLFDVLMTLYGIHRGYAHEVNPLFVNLVFTHPYALIAGKVLVPGAFFGYVRAQFWWSRPIRWEAWGVAVAYALLALWHVYGLIFWGLIGAH